MNKTLLRAGALSCALFATTALTSPAAAQPRRDYSVTDENSVNVTTRQFEGRVVDISIGAGSAQLSASRQLGTNGRGNFEDMYPVNEHVGYYTTALSGTSS